MLIAAGGFGQLTALIIHIIMALRGAVDAIGPVQTGVEPLRAVRGGTLGRQHVAHFVVIGLCVGLGGEITTFPAPIAPRARQTVKDLLGTCLSVERRALGRFRTPQERWHTLFLDALHLGRHACLAEILLGDHIGCDLAPAFGDLAVLQLEDDRAVRVPNFRRRAAKGDVGISILPGFGKLTVDLHGLPLLQQGRRCGRSVIPAPVMRTLRNVVCVTGGCGTVPCGTPERSRAKLRACVSNCPRRHHI